MMFYPDGLPLVPESQLRRNSDGSLLIGRISVEQATSIARSKDGLLPGQIVLSDETDAMPDISVPEIEFEDGTSISPLRMGFETDSLDEYIEVTVDDWFMDIVMELDDCTEESKAGYEYKHRCERAKDVGEAILDSFEVKQKLDSEKPINFEQHLALLDFVNEFIELNPEAVIDPSQPGSAKGLNEFIRFYKTTVHDKLGSREVTELLQNQRKQLVKTLRTPAMSRQFGGRENIERIATVFETQPLVVTDPLTTIMNFKDTEPFGWFVPDERLCYIDPITITRRADSTEVRDVKLAKTMAHEFLHAATNDVYRVTVYNDDENDDDKDNELNLRHDRLWPTFLYESMVEKGAFSLTVASFPEYFDIDTAQTSSHTYEETLRVIFSNNPAEVMATSKIKDARKLMQSSYPDFRLLTDTFMDRADWKKAGLSRIKADNLLVKAFFTHEDRLPSQDNTARKTFMHSLHTATHPGFLTKLGILTDLYGPELMLDVVENPKFDSSNADSLPYLASPKTRTRLAMYSYGLSVAKKKMERLVSLKAPEQVLEPYRNRVSRLEIMDKSNDLLTLATKGLKNVLLDKYGYRRRHESDEERLLRRIFGEKSKPGSKYEKIDVPNLEEQKATIEEWRNLPKILTIF